MKRKNKKTAIIPALIIFLAVIILAGIFLIHRYAPTNEKKSLYTYFDMEEGTNDILIMLDGEKSEYKGFYEENTLYVPQNWIEDEVNIRFYFDKESGCVLYTDDSHIYSFEAGNAEYSDDKGEKYKQDSPVLIKKGDVYYINFEFAARYTDCDYSIYENPGRLVVNMENSAIDYVTAESKVKVRYRGGIKSPVLEEVDKSEKLIYRKNVDEWVEVQTKSGVVGYVQAKKLSEIEQISRENTYTDNYSSIKRDNKICLTWFQVTGTAGNDMLDNMLAGTTGINVISPTWYAISDNSGNVESYARADIVSSLKKKGYEVWVLVNDFNKSLDSKELYGSKSARSKIINRLMEDAAAYGYDGINLDFEYVSKEASKDFLQFVRELSVECQRAGIVLSTDNYKAEAYNSHYNLTEQAAYVDYIILMGYDEHYAGSESGSVASISFVEDGIQKALKYVPKEKLINAMPFYTRIWTENDGTTTSRAVGMQAAIDDLKANGAPAIWDETVGQYFGSYENKGTTVKVWVEEDRSIEEKLKLYQKYELAGVAGWKLGLERKSVWSVINKYMQ